jgi:hypothetical protein
MKRILRIVVVAVLLLALPRGAEAADPAPGQASDALSGIYIGKHVQIDLHFRPAIVLRENFVYDGDDQRDIGSLAADYVGFRYMPFHNDTRKWGDIIGVGAYVAGGVASQTSASSPIFGAAVFEFAKTIQFGVVFKLAQPSDPGQRAAGDRALALSVSPKNLLSYLIEVRDRYKRP